MGLTSADEIYYSFIRKFPNYEKQIVSYKDIGDNAVEFKFIDGKTAVYYPLVADDKYRKKHTKSKNKSNATNNR